jgi:hypothetical protein
MSAQRWRPTKEEMKDECTGRSCGGGGITAVRMVPVPARAKGLPNSLQETKGWGRVRGGKLVREMCCK